MERSSVGRRLGSTLASLQSPIASLDITSLDRQPATVGATDTARLRLDWCMDVENTIQLEFKQFDIVVDRARDVEVVQLRRPVGMRRGQ